MSLASFSEPALLLILIALALAAAMLVFLAILAVLAIVVDVAYALGEGVALFWRHVVKRG